MKSVFALVACLSTLSPHAHASDASLRLGDLEITRGMSLASLRAAISDSYHLWCSDARPGVDLVSCTLSVQDDAGPHIDLVVNDDKVLTASQGHPVATESFDALLALYELMMQLTDGQDTCAIIRVSAGPPRQFSIALPEKYIGFFLHEPRYEERQGRVSMNVGLRQNPTPNIQLKDCWPTIDSAEQAPPNNAMQRSALVVTPLAPSASSSPKVRSASGAPTARRR